MKSSDESRLRRKVPVPIQGEQQGLLALKGLKIFFIWKRYFIGKGRGSRVRGPSDHKTSNEVLYTACLFYFKNVNLTNGNIYNSSYDKFPKSCVSIF